ncbi:RNA polymerase factor sigma-70 [Azorhizophilus paspali]|uniref:RNA polymerase factor sigma-70 n=1 Tax=Azorhizophilus paspali TaxID=69963 RepID=A0ABV6SNT5_AZOPA
MQSFIDHRVTLVNNAANIIGCRSPAEDVVQDTFLRQESVPPAVAVSMKTYLNCIFRIVRNLVNGHHRKQIVEQRYSGNEEKALSVAQQDDVSPESLQPRQERLERITEALSQLPERTRYAFEMHRAHGKQQKEIARELGVSPPQVNIMIRDALVHCRKALEAEHNA